MFNSNLQIQPFSLISQFVSFLWASLLSEFSVYNPRALFGKSMLLDMDFLNSALGLYMENSATFIFIVLYFPFSLFLFLSFFSTISALLSLSPLSTLLIQSLCPLVPQQQTHTRHTPLDPLHEHTAGHLNPRWLVFTNAEQGWCLLLNQMTSADVHGIQWKLSNHFVDSEFLFLFCEVSTLFTLA